MGKAVKGDLRAIRMRVLDRPVPRIQMRHGSDGVIYLGCGYELQSEPPLLIDYLERAVELRPDLTFLAERDSQGKWRRISYRQAWQQTAAIATWLISEGFGPDGQPVMILSENSLEHALLMLGCLLAGAAAVPISPTYSIGTDRLRLDHALNLIQPGLVFALGEPYASALAHVASQGWRTLAGDRFAGLLQQRDEELVSLRRAAITRGTIAKILLTSGSTGVPKGVVNTHGNLAASAQMIRQVTDRFNPERIHTIVDWLPWHHTFGGNAQFNSVLVNAGTLYIDSGRPLPGQFTATIENLREISPTGFGCVPSAYGMLADALEGDADLRQKFFKNLRWLSYGGALLPQPLWERMQWLAVQELGERLPFGTGWGMTETSSTGVGVYWNTDRTGLVGLPAPGVTLKLVPAGDRMELRIKGDHVMPRYFRDEARSAAAFDEEGFFRTADAVRWVHADQPIEGLEFAGRISEDFKLLSGTWVQASLIRRDLVEALQPYAVDAVICAPDHPWLGALLWLNRPLDEDIRKSLTAQLAAFNSSRQGSAGTITRMLVLAQPPSAAAGEITDKGSINQRRVLELRADQVALLYSQPAPAGIITC